MLCGGALTDQSSVMGEGKALPVPPCMKMCDVEQANIRQFVGMSLIFTKSIIQHKFDIDIRIEITQQISIFFCAEI